MVAFQLAELLDEAETTGDVRQLEDFYVDIALDLTAALILVGQGLIDNYLVQMIYLCLDGLEVLELIGTALTLTHNND